MDLCNQYSVHGQSCLYVTGVDKHCTNEDITSFFEVNGEIAKIIRVPEEPDQPTGRVLVQYSSERSVLRINPDSLGELPNPKDPSMT